MTYADAIFETNNDETNKTQEPHDIYILITLSTTKKGLGNGL